RRGKAERNRIAVGHQNAEANRPCKAEAAAFDGVVRGVLEKEAQKACARADGGIGVAEFSAVVTALGSLSGIVAGVAYPGHAELRDQVRLLEQRDLLGRDVGIEV